MLGEGSIIALNYGRGHGSSDMISKASMVTTADEWLSQD
jgi:hypothetical protein